MFWGQGCVAGVFPGTFASSAAQRAGFGPCQDCWPPPGCCWQGARGGGRGRAWRQPRGHRARGGWPAWLKEAAQWEASLGADLVPVASGLPLWGGPGLFLGTAAWRHLSRPPAGPSCRFRPAGPPVAPTSFVQLPLPSHLALPAARPRSQGSRAVNWLWLGGREWRGGSGWHSPGTGHLGSLGASLWPLALCRCRAPQGLGAPRARLGRAGGRQGLGAGVSCFCSPSWGASPWLGPWATSISHTAWTWALGTAKWIASQTGPSCLHRPATHCPSRARTPLRAAASAPLSLSSARPPVLGAWRPLGLREPLVLCPRPLSLPAVGAGPAVCVPPSRPWAVPRVSLQSRVASSFLLPRGCGLSCFLGGYQTRPVQVLAPRSPGPCTLPLEPSSWDTLADPQLTFMSPRPGRGHRVHTGHGGHRVYLPSCAPASQVPAWAPRRPSRTTRPLWGRPADIRGGCWVPVWASRSRRTPPQPAAVSRLLFLDDSLTGVLE